MSSELVEILNLHRQTMEQARLEELVFKVMCVFMRERKSNI
jgi:hypothetical protein